MKDHAETIHHYLPSVHVERNGNVFVAAIPEQELADSVRLLMRSDLSFLMMYATDERLSRGGFCIHYLFGVPGESAFIAASVKLSGTNFTSLAAEFPTLALYEREIMTMFGLIPKGHPDARSLILHEENWPANLYPLRKDFDWNEHVPESASGKYRFREIGGEGIYEIPVGPVHAGVIEPGNFRFSVAGEEIVSLEARLGWVHKGIEKLFENLPFGKKTLLAERVSGDSAFSHSLAYCLAIERLAGARVPERAQYVRTIFGELERLTMHIFDIGNIAGNGTGFSFMAAQGFRLTEELRRLSETLTGNRFWRGVNVPGGVAIDLSPEQVENLSRLIESLKKDFTEVIRVGNASASLANRLKSTGIVPSQVVLDYRAVGIAARCNGIPKDARVEHPYAAYRHLIPQISLTTGGDVEARFNLRIKEVSESIKLIQEALKKLPGGALQAETGVLPDGVGVGVVEGWRGEVVYAVHVAKGTISRVKVRDPSFIHWQLFSHLGSTDMVPDFPLINKSFNLSYSGNDL